VIAGQHCWKACKGQPFRSSNLLSSTTLTCKNTHGWPLACGRLAIAWSHWWSQFWAPGSAVAGISRRYYAWSQVPWTGLNGEAHAAEACALPFRACRDRSPPAGYPPTTYRITVSDREVLGERAPTRLIETVRLVVAGCRSVRRGPDGAGSRTACRPVPWLQIDAPAPVGSCRGVVRKRDERPARVRYKACPPRSGLSMVEVGGA
jgi:hypothetical protein